MLASPQTWLGNRGGTVLPALSNPSLSSSSPSLQQGTSLSSVSTFGMHPWNRDSTSNATGAMRESVSAGDQNTIHSNTTSPVSPVYQSSSSVLSQQSNSFAQNVPLENGGSSGWQTAGADHHHQGSSSSQIQRPYNAFTSPSFHTEGGAGAGQYPHDFGRPHSAGQYNVASSNAVAATAPPSSASSFPSRSFAQAGSLTGAGNVPFANPVGAGAGSGGSHALPALNASHFVGAGANNFPSASAPTGYPPGPLPSSAGSGSHYTFGSAPAGAAASASHAYMTDSSSSMHAPSFSSASTFAHFPPSSSSTADRELHTSSSSSSQHHLHPYGAGPSNAGSFGNGGFATTYGPGSGAGFDYHYQHHDPYDPPRSMPFFNPFEVKHRRRTTRAQFKLLETTFYETPKPSAATRKAISEQLDMPIRAVQIWFQNRRAKAKIQAKKDSTEANKAKRKAREDGEGASSLMTPLTMSMGANDPQRAVDGQGAPLSAGSAAASYSTLQGQPSSRNVAITGMAAAPSSASSSSSFEEARFQQQQQHAPTSATSDSFKIPAGRPLHHRGSASTGDELLSGGAAADADDRSLRRNTSARPYLTSPQQSQAATSSTFSHSSSFQQPPQQSPSQQYTQPPQHGQQQGAFYGEYTQDDRRSGQSHWRY